MDANEMKRYISETFEGLVTPMNADDTFFIYDPDGDLPAERQMPFATIVTGDTYDTVSDLSRPGAYRLNIGLTRATYTALFGAVPTERDDKGILSTGFDPATPDLLMPHPIYAAQHWVSVVNPGPATAQAVKPLLDEAYAFAVRKHANHARRAGQSG